MTSYFKGQQKHAQTQRHMLQLSGVTKQTSFSNPMGWACKTPNQSKFSIGPKNGNMQRDYVLLHDPCLWCTLHWYLPRKDKVIAWRYLPKTVWSSFFRLMPSCAWSLSCSCNVPSIHCQCPGPERYSSHSRTRKCFLAALCVDCLGGWLQQIECTPFPAACLFMQHCRIYPPSHNVAKADCSIATEGSMLSSGLWLGNYRDLWSVSAGPGQAIPQLGRFCDIGGGSGCHFDG